MAFEGRTVLVTGAGSGLGRLLALEFAREGGRVLMWDIRGDLMEGTRDLVAAEVGDEEASAMRLYECDLSDRSQVYATADRVLEEEGRVHVLVNNAGIVTGRSFLECPDELVEKTMAVNCMAHMWMAKKFLPPMLEADDGQLVNIVSAASTCGVVGLADYCASKWAAFGFDESLRMELRQLGKRGVTTTCVCPFFINTGMFEGVRGSFLLPVLDQYYVVSQIMAAAKARAPYCYLPRIVGYMYLLRGVLPAFLFDAVCSWLGISESMDTFKGRGDSWALGK